MKKFLRSNKGMELTSEVKCFINMLKVLLNLLIMPKMNLLHLKTYQKVKSK